MYVVIEIVPFPPIITGVIFQLLLLVSLLFIIIVIVVVVVVESELYEHPVVCMSLLKLRGKRRVKKAKKARGKFYFLRCGS